MQNRGFWLLEGVSDGELVTSLEDLVTSGARTEARIVAHLAEVAARGLHLRFAPSLFRYCQKMLGLSENQAFYRIQAAQLARRFPVIFELLEQRRLHLTTLSLLRDHLTVENHAELLGEAAGKTKLQILELLAARAPRPDVPSRLRKLVPSREAVAAGPTGSLEPLSSASYRLQLNCSEELKQKLELAAELMSHSNPSGDLARVVERALDRLIAELEQERFGKTKRPRRSGPEKSGTGARTVIEPGARVGSVRELRKRAHIPHEVLRLLVERDGLGCGFVCDNGERCGERAFLQVHHERPWALGGTDDLSNLSFLCRAHNLWLAERELGADRVRHAVAGHAQRNAAGRPNV